MTGTVTLSHSFKTQNAADRKVLEFDITSSLSMGNTSFKKRNFHLVTYNSGDHSSQPNYIIHHKSFSSVVSNVKAIPNEACIQHHYLVVFDLTTHISSMKQCKLSSHILTWKFGEPALACHSENGVEPAWSKL